MSSPVPDSGASARTASAATGALGSLVPTSSNEKLFLMDDMLTVSIYESISRVRYLLAAAARMSWTNRPL